MAHGGEVDGITDALAGVIAIMLLVQFGLIRTYRRLRFSLAFWSFSFPVAATSNFIVRFTARWDATGTAWIAWLAISIATAFIVAIAAASVVPIVRSRLSPAAVTEPTEA